MPIEPPASPWAFPDRSDLLGMPHGQDLVAVGADLAPGTLLAGYRSGMFAMPDSDLIGWWSPDPRGVLRPADVHVSGSLRRALPRFTVSLDRAFAAVVTGCADPSRPHGWISAPYAGAYAELHALGWAHSIEVWDDHEDLVGGLFVVEVGGLCAAESKFHRVTDASKVAVVALAALLAADDDRRRVIDVQWRTDHLATLGAVEVPRGAYLAQLPEVLLCDPALTAQPGTEEVSGSAARRIRWRSD